MARRCRLYLITPPEVSDIAAFAHELDEALDGGDVACLQIRLKSREGVTPPDSHLLALGRHIVSRAQDRGVAVLVNDRPDLAVELGADGAHIGHGDMPYAQARKLVGPSGIVGVTCHDSRHLAMEAAEAGADYVAFGAFFPTTTKDAVHRPTPDLIAWWAEMMTVPCVAIGGITPQNCAPLVAAGADFLAVVSAVWGHPEGPAQAVKEFLRAIEAAAAAAD